MHSKSSSFSVAQRGSSKRQTKDSIDRSAEKRNSLIPGREPGQPGALPVYTKPIPANASNNLNGDELNKVHGAEGGFFCQ